MRKVGLFAFLLILFSGGTWAEEVKKDTVLSSSEIDNWSVNVWGLSYHFDRESVRRKNLNEINGGIGLRRDIRWKIDGLFAEADYIQKNSVGGYVATAGIGIKHPIVKVSNLTLSVGGAVFYGMYEVKPKGRTVSGFGYAPGFSIGKGKTSLEFTLLPQGNEFLKFEAIVGYINVRF